MSISQFLGAISKVILNPLIILGFGVAILYFFYGVFKLIQNAGDVKSQQEGKDAIMWGLIGLFIMVGVFGIINIILNTFGINSDPSVSGNAYLTKLLR